MTTPNTRTIVSATCTAPGKVILFGEHAVVYKTMAIAASLSDLRIAVTSTFTDNNTLTIEVIDPVKKVPLIKSLKMSEILTTYMPLLVDDILWSESAKLPSPSTTTTKDSKLTKRAKEKKMLKFKNPTFF